jgi:hypothetical protein
LVAQTSSHHHVAAMRRHEQKRDAGNWFSGVETKWHVTEQDFKIILCLPKDI